MQQQELDIEEFAEETGLKKDIIKDFMSEYQFKRVISKEAVRKRLAEEKYRLLEIRNLTDEIIEFIELEFEKYRAEGD